MTWTTSAHVWCSSRYLARPSTAARHIEPSGRGYPVVCSGSSILTSACACSGDRRHTTHRLCRRTRRCRSQLVHEKRAAEVCVARRLRHGWCAGEGLHEVRVGDETGRAPAAEAREGAAHVRVEREQRLFTVLRADAHSIRRVEAEDARPHVAHGGQHALDCVWRQPLERRVAR